jgi:Tfp pilus assembly PilM family ATPase
MQAEPARGGVSVSRLHLQKFDEADSRLAEALSAARRELKVSRVPVIACLPRQMVNVRMLELPSTDPVEIADMVDLQSGRQTPYSQAEIVSDYRVVGSSREGYTRVMLAIVQRSLLRQRFHLLEEAGVDVDSMSISSEGLLNWCVRALPPGGKDGAADVVLDVDSFYTDLMVVANGVLIFTRSILVGANQLLGEYEKWKEKFAREVRRSLEICRGETPGLNADRLVITGAGARVEGLEEFLGGELGMRAQVRDSVSDARRMPNKPSPASDPYRVVSLTPLLGMAMAPDELAFNLVPDSVRTRKGLALKARSMAWLGILLMAALVSFSVYVSVKYVLKQGRLNRLRAEIARTEPAVQRMQHMQSIIRVVRRRQAPEFAAIKLLVELRRLTPGDPGDLVFDSVSVDAERGQLLLSGSGTSRRLILDLAGAMEGSPLFEAVRESGTSRLPNGRVTFEMAAALEKQE